MRGLARDLDLVTQAIHSIFLYAACTEDGYVKVGISGQPAARLLQINAGSPSPVGAAQWVWIGSLTRARQIERSIRKEWAARHTRGEWYRFDYSRAAEKVEFHATLDAVVEVATGSKPEWQRFGPRQVEQMVRDGQEAEKATKSRRKKHPWQQP